MRESIALNQETFDTAVRRSVRILKNDGVILYPTDTLYGLGVDAFSDEAVEKVYAIKGRDERKPIHCVVSGMAMAEKYVQITDMARKLAGEFLPGPLTLILQKRTGIKTGIARGIGTIGVRIPKSDFCLELAKGLGKPITATSANRSGRKTGRTVEAILKQLGLNDSYSNVLKNIRIREKTAIDLVIDSGELPDDLPSTVVDLSGVWPIIMREGAIPASEIWDTLREEP